MAEPVAAAAAAASSDIEPGVPFDPSEMFEEFDANNVSTGRLVRRANVHARGLFHRSVCVLVFNSDGQVLLQRRHSRKDVAPSTWDLSCAEHLTPYETYAAAASRGLYEELGIKAPSNLICLSPAAFLQDTSYAELGLRDREFTEVYALEAYNGEIVSDPNEVSAIEWCEVDAFLKRLRDKPDTFAPWVVKTVDYLVDHGYEKFAAAWQT